MTHPRRLVFGLVLGLVTAMPASGDTLADRLVRMLRQDGFDRVEVGRTWLGRTRIVATGDEGRREIVFNPRTGEILRDLRDDDRGDDDDRDDDDDDRDDSDDSDSDDNGGDDNGGGDDGGGDDGGGGDD